MGHDWIAANGLWAGGGGGGGNINEFSLMLIIAHQKQMLEKN